MKRLMLGNEAVARGLYEAGCGVPCDLDRAIALYDQAAALGDGYAHEEASRLRLLRNNRRRKWDFESLQ